MYRRLGEIRRRGAARTRHGASLPVNQAITSRRIPGGDEIQSPTNSFVGIRYYLSITSLKGMNFRLHAPNHLRIERLRLQAGTRLFASAENWHGDRGNFDVVGLRGRAMARPYLKIKPLHRGSTFRPNAAGMPPVRSGLSFRRRPSRHRWPRRG